MLGTGSQYGRGRGEDGFYIPVRARKNKNSKQQKTKNDKNEGKNSSTRIKDVSEEDRNPKEPINGNPASESMPVSRSNLNRFLESTTPSMPAQYFSKTTLRGCRTCDVEFQPYFTLDDLAESVKEWSAYGVGVPLVLNGGDSFVQYYVPYLSGIQLYAESARSTRNSMCWQASEDSDGGYYRDSNSEGSSDYEIENCMRSSREQQGWNHLIREIPFSMRRLCVSDEQSEIQDRFSSDDGEGGNSRDLIFEFFEQDPPYSRGPLESKILDLTCRNPGLKTLRSCDLLPSSWMSVAWYPIYRIPNGPTLKDLDACFLTYHFLSTTVTGAGGAKSPVVICPSEMDGVPKISLPVFGMAFYKFKGYTWTQNGISECELANSLMQAADNWLSLLQVNHPDFQFFASHGFYDSGGGQWSVRNG